MDTPIPLTDASDVISQIAVKELINLSTKDLLTQCASLVLYLNNKNLANDFNCFISLINEESQTKAPLKFLKTLKPQFDTIRRHDFGIIAVLKQNLRFHYKYRNQTNQGRAICRELSKRLRKQYYKLGFSTNYFTEIESKAKELQL